MSTPNFAQNKEKMSQRALSNIETISKNENVNTSSSHFSAISSSVLALRTSVKQRQKKEQEKLRD